VDANRHRQIVEEFAGRRIVVLGDLMTDEYVWGRATRISPESPVMVVDVERESSVPGGAANVVNNLVALGAKVSVVGVVGDDEAGVSLKNALLSEGANIAGVVTDPSRPTTRKTRIVAHSQQVLRIDREQARPIAEEVSAELLQRLSRLHSYADAIVVSDYNKGVVTPRVAEYAVELANEVGQIISANPKPASAKYLRGVDVLQLNQSEAEMAATILGSAALTVEWFDVAAQDLAEKLGAGTLVITRGGKGLALYSRDRQPCHVAPHPVEVYDPAGAGDTVISTLTLAMAAGADVEEAAVVANHAAACVVRKVGVATVSVEEILAEWHGGA
jgi:D-beta-D-heptose 7-phosphate kinase/D-beta-D-heptose 1-phosphate adenosyltransferase